MKKFLSTLENAKVAEWDVFYFDVLKLKDILHPLKKRKDEVLVICLEFGINISSNDFSHKLNDANEELICSVCEFKDEIITELNRIYFFYTENMIYYKKRFDKIIDQLTFIKNTRSFDYSKQKKQLELAIKELYKELNLMKGFININIEAERLLMKKIKIYCDAVFSEEKYVSSIKQISDYSIEPLASDHKIDQLLKEIETAFITFFYKDYKISAKKILTNHINQKVYLTGKQFFMFGVFWGVFAIILIITVSIAVRYGIDMDNDPEFNLIFPMFRGQINICLFLWFIALNVYMWNKYSVNYRLIFKFNNHYSNFITLLKRATVFSSIVGFMILYYIVIRTKSSDILETVHYMPIRMAPLISWICFLVYFLCPFDAFNLEGRKYFFQHLRNAVFNFEIETSSFFIMSLFGSGAGIIRDFIYSLCYYYNYNQEYINGERSCDPISTPLVIISLIPPIIISLIMTLKWSFINGDLFLQSVNFLRFFFSIATIAMALSIKNDPQYWVIWAITACWTAIHSFYWDVKLDWGLLQTTSENFLLRDKLAIKTKWIYYIFIGIDLCLRFLWVLIISPDVVYSFLRPEFVFMILYWGEACRRGISNYMIIEYEHICTCNNFRATQAIETPFTKDEKGNYIIKSEAIKEYNLERDKVNERLHKIIEKSFLNSSKWIKNKDFLKRLELFITENIIVKSRKTIINNKVQAGSIKNQTETSKFKKCTHIDKGNEDLDLENQTSKINLINISSKSDRKISKGRSTEQNEFDELFLNKSLKADLFSFSNRADDPQKSHSISNNGENWRFTKNSYFNK